MCIDQRCQQDSVVKGRTYWQYLNNMSNEIYHTCLLIFDTQSVDCWVVGLAQVSPLPRYV